MSDIHVINVDAVMELVTEYAASWGRNELARLTRVNGDKHQIRMHESRAAIRALLEPHDAARLRETIAFIADTTDIDEHGRSYFTCTPDEFRMEADAVIRAIGGAR